MFLKWISINICHFVIHLLKMTSYNTYPPLLSALPEVLEGLRLVENPQAGSVERGPRGIYHLNVVQTKRQGLVAKEKLFKKKYKKYNKLLNQVTWLNACSSGISIATESLHSSVCK